MPTLITGNPATGHGNPINFNEPADGDAINAASVTAAYQALADVVALFQAQGARLDLSNTFTQAEVFQALVTFQALVSLNGGALQSILKSGTGRLQIGTSIDQDLELVRNGTVLAALGGGIGGLDMKNNPVAFVSWLLFQNVTSDPVSPSEGTLWCRSNSHELRARMNSVTRTIALGPVDGLVPSGDWTALTAGANWSSLAGNNACAYMRMGTGMVKLKGGFSAGAGAGTAISGAGALPTGFRPASSGERRFVGTLTRAGATVAQPFTVDSAGTVTLLSVAGGVTTSDQVWLDAAAFMAEQ